MHNTLEHICHSPTNQKSESEQPHTDSSYEAELPEARKSYNDADARAAPSFLSKSIRNNMLPKKLRLNSEEVEAIMKKGRRLAVPFFNMSSLVSKNGKIAVIIPKKLAKTSVLRHRHKRRIMAALAKLPLPNTHVILTLKQDISSVGFKDLCGTINGILAEI